MERIESLGQMGTRKRSKKPRIQVDSTIAGRGLLIFGTSAAPDPYVNSIVHAVQELNVTRLAVAVIAEPPTASAEAEARANVIAENISQQFKALIKGHYRRHEPKLNTFVEERLDKPEARLMYLKSWQMLSPYNIETFGVELGLIGNELKSRLQDGDWLFDATALKKNLLVDVSAVLLSLEALRLFTFEIGRRPTFGQDDLIHALGSDYLYRNLLDSSTVRMAVKGIRLQDTLPDVSELISVACVRFQREYDFHLEAARACARRCERTLGAEGIKAMVTYRAKDPGRLREKLEQRARTKKYRSADDALEDIVDLAGVRVALYFPGDQKNVTQLISNNFQLLVTPKIFPDGTKASSDKRFSGYGAVHLRVTFGSGDPEASRFAGVRIEIQVASVLMHAWAEVEHDLAYKPLQGVLSGAESLVLDQLNGLVLAGELSLQQLQQALNDRIARQKGEFLNHYDLASFVYENLPKEAVVQTTLGRIDLLFECLKDYGAANPEMVSDLVSNVSLTDTSQTLAQRLAVQFIEKQPEAKSTWDHLSQGAPDESGVSPQILAIRLLNDWAAFDKRVRERLSETGQVIPETRPLGVELVGNVCSLTPELSLEFRHLRNLRNDIAHVIRKPSVGELIRAIVSLERLTGLISAPPVN